MAIDGKAIEPAAIVLMDDQPPTCGECGRRIDLEAEPCRSDEDGPIYRGSCPVHGVREYQTKRPACPECGDEEHIYATLDARWNRAEQRWELLPFRSGESPAECTECDAGGLCGEPPLDVEELGFPSPSSAIPEAFTPAERDAVREALSQWCDDCDSENEEAHALLQSAMDKITAQTAAE